MKRMTYMSSFARPLSTDQLRALGDHAAQRNAQEGITGALLTLGSVFFQIIEGDDAAVDDLYGRVLGDDRHTDIICLRTEADVAHRLFPDWSMNVFELDYIGGDVVDPLKILLGRLGEAQNVIERYTQPAVSRIMTQGLNPLEIPLRKVDRLVLFTDMVAFTAISDRLPIKDVSELVSVYLETCSTTIARHGGEVTKFLGDGVMAYFDTDADDVDAALQSCLDIHHELGRIREGAGPLSALRLLYSGFGLALGPVIEGSMGSSVKMDYTIIGEPVNTASKLEALTRRVNTPILMTQAVAEAAQGRHDTSFVERCDIGRGTPISVYALADAPDEGTDMRSAVAQALDAVATLPT